MPLYQANTQYRKKTPIPMRVAKGVLSPDEEDTNPIFNQSGETQDDSSWMPPILKPKPQEQPKFVPKSKVTMMPPPGMRRFQAGDTITDPEVGVVGESGPEVIAPADQNLPDPNFNPADTSSLPPPTPPVDPTQIAAPEAPVIEGPPPLPSEQKSRLGSLKDEGTRFLTDTSPNTVPSSGTVPSPAPVGAPSPLPAPPDISASGTPPAVPNPPVPAADTLGAKPPTATEATLADIASQKKKLTDQQKPAPNNWAQRLGLAVLSMTKFGPIANQLIHPKWTDQQRQIQAQLGNLEGQKQDVLTNLGVQSLADQREASALQRQESAARVEAQQQPHFGMTQVPEAWAKENAPDVQPDVNGQYWIGSHRLPVAPAIPSDKASKLVPVGSNQGLWNPDTGKWEVEPTAVTKPPTAEEVKYNFQKSLEKMAVNGELPNGALTDIPRLIKATDASTHLLPAEKASIKSYLAANNTPGSADMAAAVRAMGIVQARQYPMLDTGNNNQLLMMSADDINKANQLGQGRYVPAELGSKVLGRNAMFNDIYRNIDMTRSAINNMEEMSPAARGELSAYLRSTDPQSGVSTFLKGETGRLMTPRQMEFARSLASLAENAMTIRSAAGISGATSDKMKDAIVHTLPSAADPNNASMIDRLDKLKMVADTLHGGLPQLGNATKTHGPAAPGYVIGQTYRGLKYLGGKIEDNANWERARQ